MRPIDMTRLGWMALAAAGVAILVTLWLLIGGYPGGDSSVFIYVADGLLSGELPYVDRWDHKGPLIYLVNAVGRLLTPEGWLGVNLLQMASLAACALMGFWTLRPAFGSAIAAYAMVAAGVVTAGLLGWGNSTEEWALLPQFAALLLYSRVSTLRRPDRRDVVAMVAIGALGAIAFLFRPNLVGTWLAIGAVWLLVGRWRSWRLALAIAGGLASLALAAFVMLASGTAEAFWDAVVTYNGAYVDGLGPVAWLERAVDALVASPLLVAMVLAWGLALVVLLKACAMRRRTRTLLRWAVVAAPVEILLVSVSDRAYVHYFLACVPVFSVLAALVAWWTFDEFRSLGLPNLTRTERRRTLLACALGSAWLTVVLAGAVRPAVTHALPQDMSRYELAASQIRGRTAPGDPVLLWGGEPILYLLADRDAPSRYFYHLPLVTAGYGSDALADSFAAGLAKNPPKLIVDTRMRAMPPLDPDARADFEPLALYPVDPEIMRPLYEFVEAHYTRGSDVGPWPAYQLNEDVGG